jgi:asparagine synthase (glutamine-hydrolysing)
MAVALEVRSPFLDHRVVELANALPDESLIRGRVGKRILRERFAPELPPAVGKRGKQGFASPIGDYFRTTLKCALHDTIFARNSFIREHFRFAPIENLLHEHEKQKWDHTHRIFALFMIEIWAQQFKPTIE